ncbi:hypothetical protein HDV05_005393 [Chytridiales sp. JEL 0842]|nr:hypothetical protein HDV05_005393 [Chytridiales sp. JEL 0842]
MSNYIPIGSSSSPTHSNPAPSSLLTPSGPSILPTHNSSYHASSSSSSSHPYSPTGGISGFVHPTLAQAAEDGERVNKYETRLGMRLDMEAAAAYLLGAFSGVLLLILETRNDYIRFHAWQSTLTFLTLGVLQFFLALFSTFLAWVVVFVQIGLMGYGAYCAYTNADTLLRIEFPYVGPVASNWVDSE